MSTTGARQTRSREEQEAAAAEKAKIAKEAEAFTVAQKEAQDISLSFFGRMKQDAKSESNKAKAQKRKQELEAGYDDFINQKYLHISLSGSDTRLAIQVASTGTSFNFLTKKEDAITTKNINEFCDVVNQYHSTCKEQDVEGLVFELSGSDPAELKQIARALEEKGIKLDRLIINGPDGKPLSELKDRKAIDKFLSDTDASLSVSTKKNRVLNP